MTTKCYASGCCQRRNEKREKILEEEANLLLHYVTQNDIVGVKSLLRKPDRKRLLLRHQYSSADNLPVLYLACKSKTIKPGTVKCLLDAGADPCQVRDNDGCHAVHLAAKNKRVDLVELLMVYDHEQLNCLDYFENNCLLLILKHTQNCQSVLGLVETLVQKTLDVNQADINNEDALYVAAEKNYRRILEMLSKREDITLTPDTFTGEKTIALIEDQQLLPSEVVSRFTQNSLSDKTRLFQCAKEHNLKEFVSIIESLPVSSVIHSLNEEDSMYTLLQLSCIKGNLAFVQYIIENGGDTNKTSKNIDKRPIALASNYNHLEIVEALLKFEIDYTSPDLATLLATYDLDLMNHACENLEKVDNRIDILSDSYIRERYGDLLRKKGEINRRNSEGYPPLYYAIWYDNYNIVHDLLKHGASLAVKSKDGEFCFKNMDAEELKIHLDSCVRDSGERNVKKALIDYRSFKPNHTSTDCERSDLTKNSKKESLLSVIVYMSYHPDFRELLSHPVIVVYLLKQWQKAKYFFYFNLFFYLLFCTFLTAHIILNDVCNEIKPLIHCYLIFTYFCFYVRELFQILTGGTRYFSLNHYENYFEILLVVIVPLLLIAPTFFPDIIQELSSYSVLLAFIVLIFHLGRHPSMCVYVEMFRKVFHNFVQCFLFYFLLVAAFAVSFQILSGKTISLDPSSSNFVLSGAVILKIISMMNGELGISEDNHRSKSIFSIFLFILFIFMVVISLMNLLNGLAVSDTNVIKNEAELISYISLARYNHTAEQFNRHFFYVLKMLRKKGYFGKLFKRRSFGRSDSDDQICVELEIRSETCRTLCNLYYDAKIIKNLKKILRNRKLKDVTSGT